MYQYDKNGRLIDVLDEDNYKTTYLYDANSNITEKKITGGLLPTLQDATVSYEYDALNRLTKRTDNLYVKGIDISPKEYTYTYDELGRLVNETDDEGKSTRMSYDALGNLKTLTYPDETVICYSYDVMNRVKSVTDRDGTNTYTYDKLGRRTRLDFANGSHEKYTYDKKGRTLSQVTGDKRNVTMTIHDYVYDNDDNIISDVFKDYKTKYIKKISHRSYTYDKLNQLIEEKEKKAGYEGKGKRFRYFYDVSGNRIQKTENKLQTTSQSIFHIEPKVYVTNYEYSSDNELIRQHSDRKETIGYHRAKDFTFDYDKRGNLTRIKSRDKDKYVQQFYYDGSGKLRYSSDKQNKLTRYSYDGAGRRILKESETILAMTDITMFCSGDRGELIEEQIVNLEDEPKDYRTTQNFVYNPVSTYDDVILTYGKNMHTQRFIYGADDKDRGLIKIDSYQLYGHRWDENSGIETYSFDGDLINKNYAKETLQSENLGIKQYVIKDIRESIEQLTSKWGYKALTYTYTAFGKEKFPMNLNDIHGFSGYVRDRETRALYANERMYLSQVHE